MIGWLKALYTLSLLCSAWVVMGVILLMVM